MPRFFFDIQNGGPAKDDTGLEIDTLDEVRSIAMRTLSEVAYDGIPDGGDRQNFTMLVSDERGAPVYVATLNFTGMTLHRS